MNRRLINNFIGFIGHNKYWIVGIIGVFIVGFFDENSITHRINQEMEIRSLKEQIAVYNERYEKDEALLKELRRNPEAIARIARERYMMRTDDEDIFVLDDDERTSINK